MHPLFTVFTPTYNRAEVLHRVFDSLCQQTCMDFEWLIVDDGSTDQTRELVAGWQAAAQFQIRYFWQENGHKKAAFNRAVAEARGELFLPLDSDDACRLDALATFLQYWNAIPDSRRNGICGMACLCVDEAGKIVGERFPVDVMEVSLQDMSYRYRISGETWGFIRTELLRQFPFPQELPGHVPESVVWGAIGLRYKTCFVNVPLRTYFSSADSIMACCGVDVRRNAADHAYWARQVLSQELGWFRFAPQWFIRMAINWGRFSLHDRVARGVSVVWPQGGGACVLCVLGLPAAMLLAWRDVRRSRFAA